MNKRAFIIIPAILVLALIAAPVLAADPSLCPERTITVNGDGEVLATPDIATINVGVQTQNADVKIAQQENARIMDGMINAIMRAGIPREDIQSVGYNIYPVYDSSPMPFGQKVQYYQVTNSVQVTVRNVTQTGEIIDAAVANGANQVNSISFSLSPRQENALRSEVLTMAVDNAKTDADTLARATGVTITGVQTVTVGSVYIPVYYDTSRSAGAAESKAMAVPTPVQPGQIKVTAQVTIAYLIQ